MEVDTAHVSAEEIRELGPVFVGHSMWQRVGLPDILAEADMPARARVLTVDELAKETLLCPSCQRPVHKDLKACQICGTHIHRA